MIKLPKLVLAEWLDTRDALHGYARVLGKFRGGMMPPQKHWWHITLHVSARGLTTTPLPAGSGVVEMVLSPVGNQVEIQTGFGGTAAVPLSGQSQRALYDEIASALEDLGVRVPAVDAPWSETECRYDPDAAQQYWLALSSIDQVFKEFKGRLREETGPVHVFPHHFDLSLNWFSGRRVPGADPVDEETADEQMNFGFVTGDESIKEAYFYATAYPRPPALLRAELPDGSYWHTEGFTGAVLMYENLLGECDPRERLLDFFGSAQHAGARLMC